MKEKIYDEIRRLKLASTHVWCFQQYNIFRANLNPIERNNFFPCMEELCSTGIFVAEQDGSVKTYRLTETGEKEIYI